LKIHRERERERERERVLGLKKFAVLGLPSCDGVWLIPTRNKPQTLMCYHAKFGPSRSNGTSVPIEIYM